MALDSTQRKWLKALGALVGEAPAAADDEEEDEQADEPGSGEGDAGGLLAPTRKSRKSRLAEGLDGAPGAEAPVAAGFVPELLSWSGAVLKLLSKIGPGQCTCAIQVHNKTGLRISRSVIRPESQILKLPPDSIEPNDHGEFVMGGPPPLIPGSNLPIAGCIGQMDWIVTGDVNLTIKWDNPIAGDITSDASLTDIGPASAFSVDHINTNKHQAEFKFTIFGGPKPPPPNPGPNPNPGPGPAPAGEIASSCLVHVKNTTQQRLTLKDAGHDRGDFMVKPKTEIEAGGADDDIVSIETPRGKENGCKGFLEYTIGNPPAGVWRLEWDNPEGQKNTAKGTIDPASKTLSSLALIGQGDENVGADFTLRDAGGAPPTPVPPTPVPPNPVPPNPVPPDPTPPNPTPPNPTPPGQLPKTRQPTLRVNDKSADGWVEYLQERLNDLIKAGLKVDGVFGPKTLAKVHDFQVSRHLQNDGTVGNQTWAALRDATPEDPGTDGRKPHSFVQKGPQARWEDEKERALYIADLDMMLILLVSVGTEPIDSFSVDVTVTAPGMPASTKSVVIGPPNKKSTTGSGDLHNVLIHDFRKVFPSKDPAAKVTDYAIQAVLPQALSGEGWTGPIVVG